MFGSVKLIWMCSVPEPEVAAPAALWPQYPGSFACHGYEGQHVIVLPDHELVIVHLGKTPADQAPLLDALLLRLMATASA